MLPSNADAHPKPLVVFGWGNESRGDDALGPLLLARTRAWGATCPTLGLDVVEGFQLQVEDIEELQGRELALFLDASVEAEAPFAFTELREARDPSFTTHALSPAALLHAYRAVLGQAPPPAFLLAVRGERFELGEGLSLRAAANLAAASHFLEHLLGEASPERWRELAVPALGWT